MHIELGPHSPSLSSSLVAGDVPLDFFQEAQRAARVAIDIETDGLDYRSNQIGAIQFFNGKSFCIVRPPFYKPHNLIALLSSAFIIKIFHHAMFDLRFIKYRIGGDIRNIACTKVASKIVYPDRTEHSLAGLLRLHKGVVLDKSLRHSDWVGGSLSQAQLLYAMKDVYYLSGLLDDLMYVARTKGVENLVARSFEYIPSRVELDLIGAGDVFIY